MSVLLFTGNRVSEFATALAWYEKLLGGEPAFLPHDTEAVWELAADRYLYIEEDADDAGGGLSTILVDDLAATVAAISARGIEPAEREEYSNGARKAIYRDADGNEIGYGVAPQE